MLCEGIVVFISDTMMEEAESLSHYREQSCPPKETPAGEQDPLPVFMASLDLGAPSLARGTRGSHVCLCGHGSRAVLHPREHHFTQAGRHAGHPGN